RGCRAREWRLPAYRAAPVSGRSDLEWACMSDGVARDGPKRAPDPSRPMAGPSDDKRADSGREGAPTNKSTSADGTAASKKQGESDTAPAQSAPAPTAAPQKPASAAVPHARAGAPAPDAPVPHARAGAPAPDAPVPHARAGAPA